MEKITQRQTEKFEYTFNAILDRKKRYQNSGPLEKDFIETEIGANLWYIKSQGYYSGHISENAQLHKEKISFDHQYPRKKAAKHYLTKKNLTLKYLINSYVTKYGQTNKVTKSENKKLQAASRKGVKPEDLYSYVGIKLIKE